MPLIVPRRSSVLSATCPSLMCTSERCRRDVCVAIDTLAIGRLCSPLAVASVETADSDHAPGEPIASGHSQTKAGTRAAQRGSKIQHNFHRRSDGHVVETSRRGQCSERALQPTSRTHHALRVHDSHTGSIVAESRVVILGITARLFNGA